MSRGLFLALSSGHYSGGVATSGATVTADTAAKVAAYKRGCQLLCDYVGKTPFHVLRDGEKYRESPAWSLVRTWAQPYQVSAGRLRSTLVDVCLRRGGNGYAWIERNEFFEPVGLWIVDPGVVRPERIRGAVVYHVRGFAVPVPAYDMLHIRGWGGDELCGEDPLRGYARDVLGLAISQQDFASKYYESGGVPSTYFKSDVPLNDDSFNRLTSQVSPLKGSAMNPHHIPVLEQGELRSLGVSAGETQILSAREFSLKDIANCLGLPVHKLNGDGRSSYKSLEEENRSFREDSLDPWFCQFEEQYSKLIPDAEANDVAVEAVRESLQRTNMRERAAYLKDAVGGPWMSRDEARAVDSLPTKGGDAEKLLKPMNMAGDDDDDESSGERSQDDVGDDAADDADSGGSAGSRDSAAAAAVTVRQLQALGDVYGRMCKRLATQATKAGGKPKAFAEFLDGFESRNRDQLQAAFGPVCGLIAGRSGDDTAAELLTEFRDQLQAIYDTTPAESFTDRVNDTAAAFERSGRERAESALLKWAAA